MPWTTNYYIGDSTTSKRYDGHVQDARYVDAMRRELLPDPNQWSPKRTTPQIRPVNTTCRPLYSLAHGSATEVRRWRSPSRIPMSWGSTANGAYGDPDSAPDTKEHEPVEAREGQETAPVGAQSKQRCVEHLTGDGDAAIRDGAVGAALIRCGVWAGRLPGPCRLVYTSLEFGSRVESRRTWDSLRFAVTDATPMVRPPKTLF